MHQWRAGYRFSSNHRAEVRHTMKKDVCHKRGALEPVQDYWPQRCMLLPDSQELSIAAGCIPKTGARLQNEPTSLLLSLHKKFLSITANCAPTVAYFNLHSCCTCGVKKQPTYSNRTSNTSRSHHPAVSSRLYELQIQRIAVLKLHRHQRICATDFASRTA